MKRSHASGRRSAAEGRRHGISRRKLDERVREDRAALKPPAVGLLPLYLKLYDDAVPKARAGFAPLLKAVAQGFRRRGIEVVEADICRVAPEFDSAVRRFKEAEVDAIVTLHLAYSPSLESVGALAGSGLPIVMLDTTLDARFGRDTDPARIMYNHGIHGAMDLANRLRRRGVAFQIVAGHVAESDVMDRAAARVRGARACRSFRGTRALRIGESFKGMGDFCVDEAALERAFGIRITQAERGALEAAARSVTGVDIDREVAEDRRRFRCDLTEDVHRRAVRVGLGLRRLLERGGYSAFSMNFLAFDKGEGPVDTVPFLEASKAMARGIGYAGEGRGFGRTTFTEIFCPDWRGNSLFLSHMGEVNPEISARKPALIERPFPFTPAREPAVVVCAPQPGPAVYVNLARR